MEIEYRFFEGNDYIAALWLDGGVRLQKGDRVALEIWSDPQIPEAFERPKMMQRTLFQVTDVTFDFTQNRFDVGNINNHLAIVVNVQREDAD